MNIVDKLREIRENKKISRKKVAEALSISSSLINEIESGRTRLSVETFLQLCNFYEINPLELLKEENKHYIILNDNELETIKNAIKVLNKINNQTSPTFINQDSNNINIGNNNEINNSLNNNKKDD